MRTPLASLFILAVACTNVPIRLPETGGSGDGSGGAINPATVATDIVRYTNEARARNGLPALRANSQLMEAARLHAQQMAERQQDAHTISGARYPTMQSRLDAVGYPYMQAAENIAWNQRSAQEVVNTLMNSTGHRANILDRGLTEIGAAMARSSKGEPYWIQVFGRPRS
jgi:uncharacterized protein YkwD